MIPFTLTPTIFLNDKNPWYIMRIASCIFVLVIQLSIPLHSQPRLYESFLADKLHYDSFINERICIYLIVDKASCKKCEYRASDMITRMSEGYANTTFSTVFLVDRLVDSALTNKCQAYVGDRIYIEKYRVDNKTLQSVSNSWIIANKGIIETGSLLMDEDLARALNILERAAHSGKIVHTIGVEEVVLDERETRIYTPTVCSNTVKDMVAIGDENQPFLSLYDVKNGGIIHSLMVQDSLFEAMLNDGESIYRDENEQPCIRTVEFLDEEHLIVLGSMPVAKRVSEERIRISNKNYALLWEPWNGNRIGVIQDSSLGSLLRYFSIRESYMIDSMLIAVYPTWLVADSTYDSLYAVTTFDLRNGHTQRWSKLDSIYIHLGIGKNMLRGFRAVSGGRYFTTQSLSKWIVDEASGEYFPKYDSLFHRQHEESVATGNALKEKYPRKSARAMNYKPFATTRAMIAFGEEYLMTATSDYHNDKYFLELYSAEDVRFLSRSASTPGFLVKHSENSFYLIYRDKANYKLRRYDIQGG